MKMSLNPRLLWADSLKGWLMLLVILGHAIQTVMPETCYQNHIWNLIYSFHMPAFMAVSGYFAYRANRYGGGKFLCSRRFRQLMIPYIVWSIINFLVTGDYSWEKVKMVIFYPQNSFWFLWVLFFINIIFIFCQWLADKFRKDELVILIPFSILLLGIMVGVDLRILGYQYIAYYFLFYTLGYCVHRYPKLQIGNEFLLGCLFFVWAMMAWFWNMHELPEWMPDISYIPNSLLQNIYRGTTALLAILFLMGISPKILNRISSLNKGIREVGVISLGYYTCHSTIIVYVVNLLQLIFPGVCDGVLIGMNFVLCISLTLVIVELLKKNKITTKIFLGKV